MMANGPVTTISPTSEALGIYLEGTKNVIDHNKNYSFPANEVVGLMGLSQSNVDGQPYFGRLAPAVFYQNGIFNYESKRQLSMLKQLNNKLLPDMLAEIHENGCYPQDRVNIDAMAWPAILHFQREHNLPVQTIDFLKELDGTKQISLPTGLFYRISDPAPREEMPEGAYGLAMEALHEGRSALNSTLIKASVQAILGTFSLAGSAASIYSGDYVQATICGGASVGLAALGIKNFNKLQAAERALALGLIERQKLPHKQYSEI